MISRGCGLLDPPCRLEGAGEAQTVEVLQTTEAVLFRPVRSEEIRVVAEHRLAAGMQHEVDGAVAEGGAQLLVLGLTLLPSSGDGGDLAAVGKLASLEESPAPLRRWDAGAGGPAACPQSCDLSLPVQPW